MQASIRRWLRHPIVRAQAERGALTEHARIAREMHDVIAHHMSMIAVRCETAPYRLPELSGPARAELAEVASAARGALTEMLSLLGVLRTEDQPPERAPQPGIAALIGGDPVPMNWSTPRRVQALTGSGSAMGFAP